jgi:HlyD family secretion protein
LKVPLGALVRADGGWAVFRVVEDRARLTPVRVRAMTDREAEVDSGLAEGADVIVFPSDRVGEGVRVRRVDGS